MRSITRPSEVRAVRRYGPRSMGHGRRYGVFIGLGLALLFIAAQVPGGLAFEEFPIGDEKELQNMKIRAVYFQPVLMTPEDKAGLKPGESDIHLELDIHSLKGDVGFGFGEWIPYLTVRYKLINLNNKKEQQGSLMPMNASDGPHYGANVKMMGAGKYKVQFTVESPEKQGLLLHVDKETGVKGRFWRKPLVVEWSFPFVPRKW